MFSLDNTTNIPRSVIAVDNGITQIDSRTSSNDGTESGGTSGRHKYQFSSTRNIIDLFGGGTDLTIVEGANFTFGTTWKKSIDTNAWDSYVRSTESFDTTGIFAISWEVTTKIGTIRQMAGIDDNPTENASYTSMSHCLYQVNSYVNNAYENGASRTDPFYPHSDKYLLPGHRIGCKVSGGEVQYYIQKGGVIINLFTSTLPIAGMAFWKGLGNRGNLSSGWAEFGNVQVHQSTTTDLVGVDIVGNSDDFLSAEDIESLRQVGILSEPGSKYGNLYITRHDVDKWKVGGTSGGAFYDLDYTHSYRAFDSQDVKTVSF